MSYSGRVAPVQPVPAYHHYPALAWNIPMLLERYLPSLGEVLVAPGQRVAADTAIARSALPGKPHLYNLSDYFNVSPKEAKKLLLKQVNDRLPDGEIIAQKKGLAGKQFRAPFQSIISAYDEETGYISLTSSPTPYTLEAFVRGTVVESIPGWGAKIETRANYVRGAFGIGGESHGVLRLLVIDPTQSVSAETIDARCTYFLLVAGAVVTADVLKRAVEVKARAVIAGSMREEELTKFLEYRRRESFYRVGQYDWRFPADFSPQDSPLTLILTEGFGQRPMCGRIFDMLVAQNGLEISVNGTTRLRKGWQRPEIIATLAHDTTRSSTNLDITTRLPQPNALVRLINPTYLGVMARVISVPQRRYSGTSGLDRLVEVEVGGGRRLMVPQVDLEVLEQY